MGCGLHPGGHLLHRILELAKRLFDCRHLIQRFVLHSHQMLMIELLEFLEIDVAPGGILADSNDEQLVLRGPDTEIAPGNPDRVHRPLHLVIVIVIALQLSPFGEIGKL